MKAVSKTIIAASIAAASMFAGAASASEFNPFTVDPLGNYSNFTADKITGNYTEIATFDTVNNTFAVSLYWQAGQFVANQGTAPLRNNVTGLDNSYSLYALYTATGTISSNGTTTTFTFLPGTGTLGMYLDTQANTVMTAAPTSGTGAFSFSDAGDDILIASGDPRSGEGTLNPAQSTCTNGNGGQGILCGAFGSETTFSLNAEGQKFFISPNPFYTMSFQSGQLNNFQVSGTQTINGSLDVVFNTPGEVPEPASVGLLGLGLLGLVAARRRNKKAA